ncbi:hypothetical protein PR048_022590 [Dryococelus australis]|uniref:Uncharacterized protein n=1 Tax=Dryococelus australis TaxID=614101 RepID=A0ABQ9H1R5_9NEOP|nr:hypothetical protein PR048_022590 [Dryococelus australis]
MARCATVLDRCATGAEENILYGGEEICELSKRFKLNERELIRTFREFEKSPDVMPDKLLHIKNTLHIIPVPSSECERGFCPSQTGTGTVALLIETIKNIMFIRIVGPPLTTFEASNCVKTWPLRGRHSDINPNSKSRTKDDEEN